MNFYDLLMLIGGGILSLAWAPQLIKILRTKSVTDVSLLTVLAVTIGCSMGEIWAFADVSNRWAYAVTNGLAVVIVGAVLVSVLVYRKRSWYYSDEWQQGEREADRDLEEGRYKEMTPDEFIECDGGGMSACEGLQDFIYVCGDCSKKENCKILATLRAMVEDESKVSEMKHPYPDKWVVEGSAEVKMNIKYLDGCVIERTLIMDLKEAEFGIASMTSPLILTLVAYDYAWKDGE